MMIDSQASPTATVRAVGAPNGASRAAKPASRIPMPPNVIGSRARSLATRPDEEPDVKRYVEPAGGGNQRGETYETQLHNDAELQ